MQTTSRNFQTVFDYLASIKQAEGTPDPGNIDGKPTEHPVKKVDNQSIPATEGSQTAVNVAAVKEQHGPLTVDATPEAKAAAAKKADAAADAHLQIGMNVQSTGNDPSTERKYRAGLPDVQFGDKSKHPARTDNDELNGGKYASFDEALSAFTKVGNAFSAAIIAMNGGTEPAKVAATPAPVAQPAPAPARSKQAEFDELAAKLGWEMAAMATQQMDKTAAEAMVRNDIAADVRFGSYMADLAGNYFLAVKKADEDAAMAEQAAAANGEGGEPPIDEEGEPPIDEELLKAILAGGAGGAGGDGGGGPGGGGGMPGGEGGPGAGGPGGEGGMPGGEMTPEELEQLMMMLQQGGPGGGAPAGPMPPAGPPAEGAGPPPGDPKVAAVRASAKVKLAKMLGHLSEIGSRSRKK